MAALLTDVPFVVGSSTDWGVSRLGTVDRTLRVATGSGVCCGVEDVTDTTYDVQFASNGGASTRLDALVARFNWATGTAAFTAITGTTSPPLVLSSGGVADTAKINRLPGVMYDGLLALVTVPVGVGVFPASGTFVDYRVWSPGRSLGWQQSGSTWWWPQGVPIFVQESAPENAPDGAIWFQVT